MSNPIVALGAVVASFTAVILWMFFAFLAWRRFVAMQTQPRQNQQKPNSSLIVQCVALSNSRKARIVFKRLFDRVSNRKADHSHNQIARCWETKIRHTFARVRWKGQSRWTR